MLNARESKIAVSSASGASSAGSGRWCRPLYQLLEGLLAALLRHVELVGREPVGEARYEHVATPALPRDDDHLTALCVEPCGLRHSDNEPVALAATRKPAPR